MIGNYHKSAKKENSAAVAWAFDQGLIQDVGNNLFNPGANITRQEIAVLMDRLIGYLGLTLDKAAAAPFTDAAIISAWAAPAISVMQQYGLMSGREDGGFDPLSNATRAEIAVILDRLIGLVE